ncbi:MAG: LamG domain-containing protein [Verrucomicrobia bacterium]|nr:LamG domain-containing protein [Verrucomicrobiota bacterium]
MKLGASGFQQDAASCFHATSWVAFGRPRGLGISEPRPTELPTNEGRALPSKPLSLPHNRMSPNACGSPLHPLMKGICGVSPLRLLVAGIALASLPLSQAAETEARIWPRVDQPLILPSGTGPNFGTNDFSMTVWARADATDRITGDLISQYDRQTRRGFHLTLKSNPGVTASTANRRHLQFGIDDNKPGTWRDCGRPGKALFAFALATHEGILYAGTCEPDAGDSGKVYRYEGGARWSPMGRLDGCNAVTALAAHQGSLYAATGKYRVAGSRLQESPNTTPGGRVFRLEAGSRWVDCGQLPDTEAVGGLVVFRGQLYASSLYKPPGFFRYEGGKRWTRLPDAIGPDLQTGAPGPRRVVCLGVHDGFIYATSYDNGRVSRFDGNTWTDCGQVGDNTQTYAFTRYEGQLHVATWRSGRVFRFEDVGRWTDMGRLGEELEVMGMVVHNGRFIAGTLPLAQVYAYDGEGEWSLWQQIDRTPQVEYRRAWTMAEYAGEVYCSTLPSGRIWATRQGHQVSWDQELPEGWHHIAAVKTAGRLSLHVDGKPVAESVNAEASTWNLSSSAPLRLGSGMNGPFNGQLRNLQIHPRALASREIKKLASRKPPSK